MYYFDPEIFFEYYGHEIDFFLKKIKSLNNINNIKIYNLEINNTTYDLKKNNMENYYNSILNTFNNIHDNNIDIFYTYL
jgi:hypothetical protein